MRSLFLIVMIFIHFGALAVVRQVSGYGTGENLEQAIYAAQGDAVLNAGGYTKISIETSEVQVLNDTGISSNALFISDYKLIESGKSFDGMYARILATLCDPEESEFRHNGKVCEGVGVGDTQFAARATAVGEAILPLGIDAQSIAIFEGEEIVKDEIFLSGQAFVTEIEEIEHSRKGDVYFSKVRFKVFEEKNLSSDISSVRRRRSVGIGTNIFEAIQSARVGAVIDLGSMYNTKVKYSVGVLDSKIINRKWTGFCYDSKIIEIRQEKGKWIVTLDVSVNQDSAAHVLDRVVQGFGYGRSDNRAEALEYAKRDAIINSACVADVATSYSNGIAIKEDVHVVGIGYISDFDVSFSKLGDDFVAKFEGPVFLARNNNSSLSSRSLKKSVGHSKYKDGYKAYLLARYQAAINAGALYVVDRVHNGNKIIENNCDISSEQNYFCFNFDAQQILSGSDDGVYVRMRVLSDSDSTTFSAQGVGLAPTEDVAIELAKTDAILNANSHIETNLKYNWSERVFSRQKMTGTSFLKNYESTTTLLENGCYLALAKVCLGDSQRRLIINFNKEYSNGSLQSALDSRRKMLIKSGATVRASMEYKDLALHESTSVYEAKGFLANCQKNMEQTKDKKYRFEYSGDVSHAPFTDKEDNTVSVLGYGEGKSFEKAMDFAIKDAVINAGSEFSVQESYSQGDCKSGFSTYSAAGYVFKVEVISSEKSGDNYIVKVLCDIASSRGDSADKGKKRVKVKGWGVSEYDAKINALSNAVDAVFGRYTEVVLKEFNGSITSYYPFDCAFAKGYIRTSKVKQVDQKDGVYEVVISAVVVQRGKEGWGWKMTTFIIVFLCVVLSVLKAKSTIFTIIVWIMALAALFATGHWAVGITIILLGLGVIYSDGD